MLRDRSGHFYETHKRCMVSSDGTQELSKENSFLLKYSCLLFPAKRQWHRGNLYIDFIAQLMLWSHNAEEYISSNSVPYGLPAEQRRTHTLLYKLLSLSHLVVEIPAVLTFSKCWQQMLFLQTSKGRQKNRKRKSPTILSLTNPSSFGARTSAMQNKR